MFKVRYTVMFDVTKAMCPWLGEDVVEGARVYRYTGPTYGCCSPTGTMVSWEYNEAPFFELPTRALAPIATDGGM